MAMRTDNIMTLVSISSAVIIAGANEYIVSCRGTVALWLLIKYVLVELHMYSDDLSIPAMQQQEPETSARVFLYKYIREFGGVRT